MSTEVPMVRIIYATLIALGFATDASAKLRVVTTLPEYAAIASEIGAESVNVTSLTRSSQDPHFIDAKPSYIVRLNRADLLIVNGLDLEIGWIPTLLVQARNPKIQPGQPGHLDASSLITSVLEVPQGTIDRSMGDIHPGGNPHFSRDPNRMRNIIRGVARRMSALAPESAERFQAKAEAMVEELTELLKLNKARWSALSEEQRRIVEYHRSWSYLFETLSVEVPARLEPKPGVPPSPSHVAGVVGTIKQRDIRTLLQESYLASTVMRTVAELTDSTHLIVESGPQFTNGERYITYIRTLLDTLYTAVNTGDVP